MARRASPLRIEKRSSQTPVEFRLRRTSVTSTCFRMAVVIACIPTCRPLCARLITLCARLITLSERRGRQFRVGAQYLFLRKLRDKLLDHRPCLRWQRNGTVHGKSFECEYAAAALSGAIFLSPSKDTQFYAGCGAMQCDPAGADKGGTKAGARTWWHVDSP